MVDSPMCNGPGCTKAAVSGGLCVAHYSQQRRNIPLKPLRGPRDRFAGVGITPGAAAVLRQHLGAGTERDLARTLFEAEAKRLGWKGEGQAQEPAPAPAKGVRRRRTESERTARVA